MTLANLQKALAIVAKYCDPEKSWCQGEHDILFFPLDSTAKLPPEDEAELLRLGAHKSSEADCWAAFT